MANHSKIKLGLIGGGYWGKNLIRDFNNIGVLHTICDIDQNTLNNYKEMYPNLNLTTNWDDIIQNKDINAVCISLPAEIHYKFTKLALENGKDVYVEKPITLDENEAKELIELASKYNRILMVGHILHYHTHVEKLKEIVKSGRIGKIKNIISNRLNLGKFRTAENVLWSFAPHDISVVLALCNDNLPNRVICMGKDCITKTIHDITNTVLYFDDMDIYVNINVNWLNPYKEQMIVIIGEKGMIVFDDTKTDDKLIIYENYLKWDNGFLPTPVQGKGEVINVVFEFPLIRECRHFVECCLNRQKPITDGNEGLRVIQVLNASHKSLLSGKEVILTKNTSIVTREYFSHPTSIIDDGAIIGKGTKIWHYSHICKDAKIGENCNIGQNVFIAGGAILGNNCKVQNNVSIYAGVEAGNYVFFGPSCVLTNDINPRGMYTKGGNYIKTIIEDGVTLGANSTIICGNTLGKHALIGAGAVICKDVEKYSIMVGNPARQIGTIDEIGNRFIWKNK
jgi:UDP-2-acetamido-3-amino-2,3-dideoxy-glucuronate N-acetyltransferase